MHCIYCCRETLPASLRAAPCPPSPPAIRISTGAFAHVSVLYAFLHVRLIPLSRRYEFFLASANTLFVPPPNERSGDNEENISADENVLKCGSEFTSIPDFFRCALDAASCLKFDVEPRWKTTLPCGFWDNDATQHMQTQIVFQLGEVLNLFAATVKCFVLLLFSPLKAENGIWKAAAGKRASMHKLWCLKFKYYSCNSSSSSGRKREKH